MQQFHHTALRCIFSNDAAAEDLLEAEAVGAGEDDAGEACEVDEADVSASSEANTTSDGESLR